MPTIRSNPDNPNIVAVETPSVPAGSWFVFDASGNGGYYSDGEREGVADWPDHEQAPQAKPARSRKK